MSLIVSIIPKETGFDINEIEQEVVSPQNDLFGFEKWRETVWGHKIMKSIGCNMINSLKETNVYAFNNDVSKLRIELNNILENINLITYEIGIDRETMEFRVNNALEYVRVAEKYIDKVGIALW